MKLSNYIQSNAERVSDLSESQEVATILSGGQTVSKSRAYTLREAIEVAVDSFDDDTAQDYPELYPQWNSEAEYETGARVAYNGVLYTVLQDHTAQSDWTPDAASSLFSKVLTNTDGTPAEWQQPDSTNAYMTGDTVIFNGVVYKSLIDNNVWSPADFAAGWQIVED